LPAKPVLSTDSNGLSYSAQVAQQFSSYRQTPSQERQPRPNSGQQTANFSGVSVPTGSADRPVRPSEMKDEG
ncbi:hypothetical protein OF83DRAFT_1063754, partial [Amylostereum chailletii]